MSIAEKSEPRRRFLGIEGGATHSVAILADAQGTLLGRIETGPGNIKLLNEAQLERLLQFVARRLPGADAVCVGLAGVRDREDQTRIQRAADRAWPKVPCRVCADLETALAAALDSGPPHRVLVLSGTGSCCYGRTPQGRVAKLGGWGHLLGDKGSGYEIGLRALKAAVYYFDRDGRWPKLGQRILRALQLNHPEDLIGWVHQAQKKDIAALAREVFPAWASRDKIASDIVTGAAHSLARDAASCAKQLVRAGTPVQFVLAGSVLLKQPRFASLVSKNLLQLWPRAQIAPLTREGAWGAVQLAQQEWRRATRCRLMAAMPSTGQGSRPGVRAVPVPEATALSPTERRNPRSSRLDRMTVLEAVELMLREEGKVPRVLLQQKESVADCVALVVRTFESGGRLFYVGAGTSGRLGVLDASECPPTFRTPPDQVQGIIAGGQNALWQSIEGAEDNAVAGSDAVRFRGIRSRDLVVGVAASGRTPFVWGALSEAKRRSARTILVCFNPHLRIAREMMPDHVLAFDLGPEVLTGSTRLKAGTATKLLLNIFTTVAMVRMGKVKSNLMVDLNPSNGKLRDRAIRIVRELTGTSEPEAAEALEQSGWVVKKASERLEQRGAVRRNPGC